MGQQHYMQLLCFTKLFKQVDASDCSLVVRMGVENRPSGFWRIRTGLRQRRRCNQWWHGAPRLHCIACQDTLFLSPLSPKRKTQTRDSLPSRSIMFKRARARATPHSSWKRRTMRAATAILALAVLVSLNLLNRDSELDYQRKF